MAKKQNTMVSALTSKAEKLSKAKEKEAVKLRELKKKRKEKSLDERGAAQKIEDYKKGNRKFRFLLNAYEKTLEEN